MHEDPNNPRLWLVTGVRYRDVKECYPEFLASLHPGDILQILAACCEQGAFKNLGAYAEWRGQHLNVGVISTKMRDEAATYLDDEGFAEVRVVTVGDKDFWVEPLAAEPLRPKAERIGLDPLPFDPSLVPFRSPSDARRQSATRQLIASLQQIEDQSDHWSWCELRDHVEQLILQLQRYPSSCLHSLCEEEDRTLRSILGCLGDVCQLLERHKGMSEANDRLKSEYEAIEQLEHEYSKPRVCARIYKEEMAELEQLACGQHGMLMQFFEQQRLAHNGQDPTPEQLTTILTSLNQWLSGFMNGWYTRTKRNLEHLACTIKCEHLTRRELYSYYSCEILAHVVADVLKGKTTIAELLNQAEGIASAPHVVDRPSLSQPVDFTIEDYDPYNIIPSNLPKQRVRDCAIAADAVIHGEGYKYAHLLKVMIDHRVTTATQSEQADFAKTLVAWHLGDGKEADKLKNSIRQRIGKMMTNRHIATGLSLPLYRTWPDNDPDRLICEQIAPFFEEAGFGYPRACN